MRYTILILFMLIGCLPVLAQVGGTVTDDHHDPLIGAHIMLLPDSVHGVTDVDGRFGLKPRYQGEKILRCSYIGHEPTELKINFRGRPIDLNIDLHLHAENLGEVVVEAHHGMDEGSLSSHHLEAEKMQMAATGTLLKALDDVPGVNAINVGVGVSKPVIRGLSANRVVVTTDNIKQEGQQWGLDHGLEVDPYNTGDVEVLKGPASLQYGSDGLGGVINIMPVHAPKLNTVQGSVLGTFRSNNLHGGGTANIGFNLDNVFVRAYYGIQDFGDYRVPTDSFTYLGFNLPIYNRTLKNTAGREQSMGGSVGVLREKFMIRADVSYYALETGIFSGAVGIPRSYALTPDGNDRNVAKPSQTVQHLKAVLSQEYYFKQGDLHLHLGYQRNQREEFSFAEYHSQAVRNLTDTLALGLILNTYSLSAHFEHRINKKWHNTYGVDVQLQQNQRSGFEHLLPNFFTTREGIYIITHWDRNSRTQVTGGIRFDHGYNNTEYRRQYVYKSDGTVNDSLVSPATSNHFYNVSGSVGFTHHLVPGRWSLKVHLGKSFRVPHPSETVSNGVHHGTFRHEKGKPDLKSEHGYQFDLSNHFHLWKLTANLTGYFNYFNNYIYLGPSAQFSPLPEAGQLYAYQQNNAIYTGAEADWQLDPWRGLYLKQVFDLVWNLNLQTGLSLPFTPPASLLSELGYKWKSVWQFRDLTLHIRYRHTWAQERTDRNERTTPAYNLFDVGLSTSVAIGKQRIDLSWAVQNLFDTFYLNNLSRYRLINVPEQGRNVVVTVRIPISAELRKHK